MFRPSTGTPAAPGVKRPLYRLLLFAAALLLLWAAVELMPPASPSDAPPVYPDDAGTVATSVPPAPASTSSPRLFSPGYALALLLLAGGAGFALYLRRRRPQASTAAALQTLGQLQLAQGQQLRLVACAGEVLLLGVTGQQITLLKSFDQEAFDTVTQAEAQHTQVSSEPAVAGQSPFAAVLQQYGLPLPGVSPSRS